MKQLIFIILITIFFQSNAQTLLTPDRVFDGEEMHNDWVVMVEGDKITYAGTLKEAKLSKKTQKIDLVGMTLMPGLIEGHSHLLLHPYNETDWNDQVLKESPVERAIRGTVHAKNTLMAGITTTRDLGAEGAGYTDVYLKKTIEDGIIPGPRMIVAGPELLQRERMVLKVFMMVLKYLWELNLLVELMKLSKLFVVKWEMEQT